MSEVTKSGPPSWLPSEVAADLKARYDGKLIPIKTEAGPVVLRSPSREAVLARFPAAPAASEARGMMSTEDGDLDKDIALALASAVYPDDQTLRGYFARFPLLGPFLASRAKVAASGIKGELRGAPSDLPDLQAVEASGVRVYTVLTDLEPGRLVLRAPSADAIRQWEASRATKAGPLASEIFALSCLLHPSMPEVQDMFKTRPLLGVYCANRLFTWGLGEVEEFQGEW